MGSGVHIKTKENIIKILELLRNIQGDIHIRGIARHLNVNPATVSNIIDRYLGEFVDIRQIDMYGFRAKLIKLQEGKEEATLNDVLKHHRIRKAIKNQF